MYDETEGKINWRYLLKRVGIVLGVIIVILGIIALITKCTKNEDTKKEPEIKVVDLSKQLDELENATLKYLTVDNLPKEINSSKTIRLKILKNKGLVKEIRDSENNVCNASDSYAEVTRLDDNYAVKLTLSCGSNKDYRIIYVGCFEECNGGICKGSENSKNGVCGVVAPDDKTDDKTNTTTNTTGKKQNNTTNKKPTTTTTVNKRPTVNNSNNSNNNNNNTNHTTNVSNAKKVTMYEFKKCSTSSRCTDGTNNNGVCEKTVYDTVTGELNIIPGKTTYVTVPVGSVKSTTVYFKNSSSAVNTSTARYTYIRYNVSKGYMYTKTYCTSGVISGSSCVTTRTQTTSSQVTGCKDSSFTYNASQNTCTKLVPRVEVTGTPKSSTSCTTTWSKSTSLSGWTRTGNKKIVTE